LQTCECSICVAGAFAAYGILSNLNAGVLVTIAWLAVVKQTGLTPIDPGQVRVLRFASMALRPNSHHMMELHKDLHLPWNLDGCVAVL
jgi:hypothetical protein